MLWRFEGCIFWKSTEQIFLSTCYCFYRFLWSFVCENCLFKIFTEPLRFPISFISQKRRIENENFEFSDFSNFECAWIWRFQGCPCSDSAKKVRDLNYFGGFLVWRKDLRTVWSGSWPVSLKNIWNYLKTNLSGWFNRGKKFSLVAGVQ